MQHCPALFLRPEPCHDTRKPAHHSRGACRAGGNVAVADADGSARPEAGYRDVFSVLRAMLFYVDEFPERLHRTKETDLLFPKIVAASAEVRDAIERLDRDHARGESAIRELQHLLTAWELLGDTRRGAFEGPASATSSSTWSTCGSKRTLCCQLPSAT